MPWTSLFDRLRGIKRVEGELVLLIPPEASPAKMPLASGPTPQDTAHACSTCGKPMEERILTTAMPSALSTLWDEAPVVVDGWACLPCGALAYPRGLSADRITAFGKMGAEHANAGRLLEADWWFTRIQWGWPDFPGGYLEAAGVIERRLEDSSLELGQKRTLERRAMHLYERAIELAQASPEVAIFLAPALIGLAHRSILSRSIDRATRTLTTCLALPEIAPPQRERAEELVRYIEEERYVFADASAIIEPYARIMGRKTRPIESEEVRTRVSNAAAELEAHYERVPHHWQSILAAAMGRAALRETERRLALYRRAHAAHPDNAHISREAAFAFLESDLVEEARAVCRVATARCETDATLWCNRALTELLCGSVDEARRCLRRSKELDPHDPIAAALGQRLEQVVAAGRMPRTLAELERKASAR